MKLNAPTQLIFVIALVLAVAALIGFLAPSVAIIGLYSFWIMTVAFVVLAAGVMFRGA